MDGYSGGCICPAIKRYGEQKMTLTPEHKDIIDRYVKKPEWRVAGKRADFNAIGERFDVSPVVARVITNRGVTGEKAIAMYLDGDWDSMHDPALMKDMVEAGEIIKEKLSDNRRIRIISDYDVDGVTSNYILLLGLRRTWAALHGSSADDCTVVDYDIPHRVHDGYGINKRLIDAAIADGVDTIITCDNGIAAIEQVRYAKERGLTVIVTDHHQIPFEESDGGERIYMLPQADAVIDNQRQDCEYPFKGLCGAGVAFKLIQYMYRICGIAESEVNEFMEILGLATNCDMMDLVDENRLYVKYALESLKDSRNPGLNALMRFSGRNEKKISTYDLGFLIGPCINAAGRLGDAKQSLEFLLERDPNVAEARARELLAVNNERKSMTEAGARHITDMLETATVNGEFGQAATLADKVLVVYIPTVHESVVGIIASRLKEAYTRPVMVFTDAETPGILKGSGRSIDSYNMFEELNRFREMFTAFGGHAMAAGFSIEKERLDELRRKINEAAVLTDEDITPKLMIDVAMPLAYNSIELTEQIERLEPYGKGNRKPLFAQAAVPVRMAQILGRNKNLLKLQLDTGYGRCVDAIDFDPDTFVNNIKQWFGEDECVKMLNGQPNAVVIDVAYYPTINEYMGRRSLQMKMEAYNKGI